MARIAVLFLFFSLLFGCGQSGIQITGNIPEKRFLNQSGNLSEHLSSLQISAEYALVIAADGTTFFLSERSFPEINLIKEKGNFDTYSTSLPPVCNLKNIIEICLYNFDFPLIDHKTPFSSRIVDFEFLGQSSRNGHFVRKYKLKEKNSVSS